MKKFYLAGVLGALLCASAFSANAAPKPDAKVPIVTRDNFVSLEFYSRADRDHEAVSLRFDNGGLRVKFQQSPTEKYDTGRVVPHANIWSEPVSMSIKQTESVLKFLNAAQVPKLAGFYYGKSKVVGFVEVLTLTISDDKDRDQKFEVQSFGDAAPRGYYAITSFLRGLQVQKFSDKNLPIPTDDWVTENNFGELKLETSGGIAGIRSTMTITPRPDTSSIRGWVWAQNIGERETVRDQTIYYNEQRDIVRLLNLARLSLLNGKHYNQLRLADGFNEVLTVTLKDGRKFVIQNYGDTAPAEYYAITKYMNELKAKKLDKQ